MKRGLINFDESNRPICPICGASFDRLASHVRQAHQIEAREFKQAYGLDVKKGICSPDSSERTRIQTLAHADKVIYKNLVVRGERTRFKHGDKGRTKDQVSLETKERLIDNIRKNPKQKAAQSTNGKLYGKNNLIKYNENRAKG